jgi:hypothetical protein
MPVPRLSKYSDIHAADRETRFQSSTRTSTKKSSAVCKLISSNRIPSPARESTTTQPAAWNPATRPTPLSEAISPRPGGVHSANLPGVGRHESAPGRVQAGAFLEAYPISANCRSQKTNCRAVRPKKEQPERRMLYVDSGEEPAIFFTSGGRSRGRSELRRS